MLEYYVNIIIINIMYVMYNEKNTIFFKFSKQKSNQTEALIYKYTNKQIEIYLDIHIFYSMITMSRFLSSKVPVKNKKKRYKSFEF